MSHPLQMKALEPHQYEIARLPRTSSTNEVDPGALCNLASNKHPGSIFFAIPKANTRSLQRSNLHYIDPTDLLRPLDRESAHARYLIWLDIRYAPFAHLQPKGTAGWLWPFPSLFLAAAGTLFLLWHPSAREDGLVDRRNVMSKAHSLRVRCAYVVLLYYSTSLSSYQR